MMKNHLIGCAAAVILSSFLFPSCVNTRSLTYMQGTFDTAQLSQVKIPEARVRPGDLLSIIVYSDNPEATALFNQSLITVQRRYRRFQFRFGSGQPERAGRAAERVPVRARLAAGAPTTPGYLVDEDGNIQFQGLGVLHVEGLTKDSAKGYCWMRG